MKQLGIALLPVVTLSACAVSSLFMTPDPIEGRIDEVGGIESLVLDGKRHYFAFSYSSDQVLSPLIDSPDVMAAYANRYVRQLDPDRPMRPRHQSAQYWRSLVDESVGYSGLTDDSESRNIDTKALRRIIAIVPNACEKDRPADLAITGHLIYLLSTASRPREEEIPSDILAALKRLGHEPNDPRGDALETAQRLLTREESMPIGATCNDAVTVFLWSWKTLTTDLVGNWRERLNL